MSTRFTPDGVPMVDSRSLQLATLSAAVRERVVQRVADGLRVDGFHDVSPSTLEFLDALACGVNVASEIARSLGVSRQMVAKTVKDLCQMEYLAQLEGKGRQKRIVFTPRGEMLMARVRQRLRDLDTVIDAQIGSRRLDDALASLDALVRLLDGPRTEEPHDRGEAPVQITE
jgi:DNA-binding MarR family transcriptional regulator